MILRRGIYSQRAEEEVYQQINFDDAFEDYIDLGNSVMNGVRAVEFYYTPDFNIPSGYIGNTIFSRQLGNNNYRLDFWFLFGKFNFQLRNSSGSVLLDIRSNSDSWTSGTEYHFALSIDPINGTTMYVDGVLQTDTDTNTSAIPTATINTYLGGLVYDDIRYIGGSVRNVQLWNVARTQAEILTDKDTYYPAGTSGLKETWHFKDELGLTVTGVNGNNGTIVTNNPSGVTYVNTVMRETI